MKEGFREKVKEKAYGFVVGASIPGVLVVPAAIYSAATGDVEALKAVGERGGVVMSALGLYGMSFKELGFVLEFVMRYYLLTYFMLTFLLKNSTYIILFQLSFLSVATTLATLYLLFEDSSSLKNHPISSIACRNSSIALCSSFPVW